MIAEVEVPLIRLVPATFLVWLAWAVQRSPYRTVGNRLLAGFLALVGLGFLLESLAEFALFPPGAQASFRAAAVATGIADPALLLALGLAFPAALPALRSPALWVGVAAAAGATVAILLVGPAGAAAWARTAYVDLAYLAAFALLLRSYAQERQRVRERPLFFVVLGVGFAALSRTGGVLFEHPPAGAGPEAFLASSLAVSLALSALFFLALRGWGAPAERARGLFLPLLGLLAAFSCLFYVLTALADPLASQWFALRWIVVGGILGYGMLRHQLFDFELRTRQAVTVLASLAVGVLAALAAADAVGPDGGLLAAQSVAVVTGVAVTALACAAGTWGWRRLRPGDELPLAYRQRRVELYQAALESSLGGARLSLGEHLFASTLRDVFAISQQEHEEVMARIAQDRSPARPPP